VIVGRRLCDRFKHNVIHSYICTQAEDRIKGLQTEAAEWKEAFKGLEDEKKELIDIALKLQERVAKHEGKALEASVMSSKQLAEYQDQDGNCLVM